MRQMCVNFNTGECRQKLRKFQRCSQYPYRCLSTAVQDTVAVFDCFPAALREIKLKR